MTKIQAYSVYFQRIFTFSKGEVYNSHVLMMTELHFKTKTEKSILSSFPLNQLWLSVKIRTKVRQFA